MTTTKLTFTQYIDADPATVASRIDAAVAAGLDAAAQRSASPRHDTVMTPTGDGLRIEAGVEALAGTHLSVAGAQQLTELRVEVPWVSQDCGTTKLWAANRFAGVLADELAA